jgi:mannose-1-phosphate guanylyltransferase/phosphomannomutase
LTLRHRFWLFLSNNHCRFHLIQRMHSLRAENRGSIVARYEGVIVAGGIASRLGALAAQRPKALLPFRETTLLAHHLKAIHAQGIRKATVIAGHLSEVIHSELGSVSPLGLDVKLLVEPTASGSGGCLRYLPTGNAPLLIIFGDVMARMDYAALIEQHRIMGATASVVVHPNDHPADSDLVETNAEGWITAIHQKPHLRDSFRRNLAVAGVFVLEPEVITWLPTDRSVDLVQGLITTIIANVGKVFAYRTSEYLKDCGTPERYRQVLRDYTSGQVDARYRTVLRPALFLDRDGTLNRNIGYITSPSQIELLPGVGEAVRSVNDAGVLALVVTNQPVLARGDCTLHDLDNIHARLEFALGEYGAFLDAIYLCPHHPDHGFQGEISELKLVCNCRKPRPGMIAAALGEFSVDLRRSAVIGDSERDVALALGLGIPAYRIGSAGQLSQTGVTYTSTFPEAIDHFLERIECAGGRTFANLHGDCL